MNCQSLLIFAGALVLLGASGCRPSADEPSTQAEAQKIYSQTKWFFAPQLAFSKRVPDPDSDSDLPPDSKNQVFFKLASGTYIIYSEYLPSSGMKAFQGHGRLESIPQVAGPIYRLEGPYTAEQSDSVRLVGFCGERKFHVQARGTNQQIVLTDALSIATNALSSLRDQARHP